MIRLCLIAIWIGVLAPLSTMALGFERKHRSVRVRAEMKLVTHADLADIQVGLYGPGRTLLRVQRLTDMLLILSARGSDIDSVLRLPNGRRPTFGRSLFRARIFAVTNGRIHTDGQAWCGSWRGDVSICQVDCDGGSFEVRRLTGGSAGNRLDLIVGFSDDWDSSADTGFAINACQYDDPNRLQISPARRNKIVPLAFEER